MGRHSGLVVEEDQMYFDIRTQHTSTIKQRLGVGHTTMWRYMRMLKEDLRNLYKGKHLSKYEIERRINRKLFGDDVKIVTVKV